jgi:beta-lactamase class A
MKSKCVFFILITIILFSSVPAWAEESFPRLVGYSDPSLQNGLEDCLASLGLDKAAERKDICVTLVDMTDPTSPRLASVNAHEMMYAASLPKIAILLGAFERIARGEMILDNGIHEKLTQMIRNSSNRAATEVLNRIGKSYLADLLQSAQYRFYDPALNGGLWVGKEYGTAAAWERDPLHNLSHGATAFQVARFYYLLETGKLISPKASKQMKEILGNPAIHHKFVRGLERARPDSRIYRKSGTWGRYHSDSAIVEHGKNRYIAVALAKSPRGEEWLSSLIVELDDLICRSEKAPTQISSRYDKRP